MDIESIEPHFAGKEPSVRAIYDAVLAGLQKLGPVTVSPKQTSIHLDNANGFAGIAARKSYLLLNFHTDYPIENPRIAKIEKHSARRWMHTVKLEQPNQVDDELLKWLADAYHLAG